MSNGAPLPCLNGNNCTDLPAGSAVFPASAARTAFALGLNVRAFVERFGLERVGFLTLTFADHVLDAREAQRRMHSLTTHVLRPRYGAAIRVIERQKSGRIHYHVLVAVPFDVRTGCDFDAFACRDYRSAPAALRSEWAFWRLTAKAYGFGRTELLPVMSSGEAIGMYVGKYIAKHLGQRIEDDTGVRLVSYVGPRVASVKFAWASPGGRRVREAMQALAGDLAAAGQIDAPTWEAMRRQYGRRWCWSWREVILGRAQCS